MTAVAAQMIDDDEDVLPINYLGFRMAKPEALMKILHGLTSHLRHFGRNGLIGKL